MVAWTVADLLLDPHGATPGELQERIAAERRQTAFMLWRDGDGRQRILSLSDDAERLTVGRAPGSDLWLDFDVKVSRVHATFERAGPAWTVVDDGLSANGSFCNGERVQGRRRLTDGDELRFGRTSVVFREPVVRKTESTAAATEAQMHLSETQRRVLVALCRPFRDGSTFATPATNQEIAAEVFLGVDAVKTHLRALFAKFGIAELPQNQKRARLVELAMRRGHVSQRDLAS
jgi:pSer/pThr/pTyr-binding forkhead associated (FHA) protein